MQLSDTALTAQMAVPSLAYAFPHSLEVNWAQYDTVEAVVVAVPLPELESVSELVPLALESSSESSPEVLESSSLSPLVLLSSSESSPEVLLSSSSDASESLESSSSESSESPVTEIESESSSSLSSSSESSESPVTSIESESPSVESPLSVVAELSVSVWPKTVTTKSRSNKSLRRRDMGLGFRVKESGKVFKRKDATQEK